MELLKKPLTLAILFPIPSPSPSHEFIISALILIRMNLLHFVATSVATTLQ